MEKNNKRIQLGSYYSKDYKLISGRTNGIDKRKDWKLEELEKDNNIETIIFEVPEYISTITSSFILGLVGIYISDYGKEEFYKKYRFETKNESIINNIETAVQYVLTEIGGI